MTDPERISKRSRGLAGQLLRAGADEQPRPASVEQTLAALGVASAVVSTSTVTGATALGGAKVASAAGSTAKAASATLLFKWIGIGVVSGVGLAGAAAVVSAPPVSPALKTTATALPREADVNVKPRPAGSARPAPEVVAMANDAPSAVVVTAPHASSPEPIASGMDVDVGAPLAAEVQYVDRARALLDGGRAEQGLELLRGYEQQFPQARLLPEVLFLELETLQRLGRTGDAQAAARRLVDGFPRSPHAARARKLLSP